MNNEYLVKDKPGHQGSVAKQLRIEGDGQKEAIIILEVENALGPHAWREEARFTLNHDEITWLARAAGVPWAK